MKNSRHLAALEELEGIEAPGLHPAACLFLHQRALWQAEAIEEEDDAQHSRYQELEVGILELIGIFREEEHERTVIPSGTVDNPHGGDEAYGTEDSDRREVLDGIQSMVFQDSERRSIRQRQRRHIESHAEGIDRHEEQPR